MREALEYARADDDIIWNGAEKEVGLEVQYPLQIIGNNARLKIPEHSVGITFDGSGHGSLSNVHFSSKQICNAINILSWTGNLDFKNIISDYNTRNKAKVYPTFVGTDIAGTGITIEESEIWQIVLNTPEFVAIKHSSLAEMTNITTNKLNVSDSMVNGKANLEALDSYEIYNTTFDDVSIKGTGTISNITINKSIEISGDAEISELKFINSDVTVTLSNGTFKISDTNLSDVNVVTNNAELLIEDGTTMSEDADTSNSKVSNRTTEATSSEALDDLNSLIGLADVKDTVNRFINNARVSIARKNAGLETGDISLNSVFSGAPGTGKTTVAKIMGRLMFEQGILPTSNFVHVGRKDLVGSHIGESEKRTIAALDKAMGGILFIDEAYSLAPDDSTKDYGYQVIDTLTDEIEKRHNDLVVILAGYTGDMKNFFNRANPGLKSRFATWVEFPDYSVDELYQISLLSLNKQFKVTEGVKSYLYAAIKNFKRAKVVNGNGRFIRTFNQEIGFAQSDRLTKAGTLDKESLMTLTTEDINNAYRNLGAQLTHRR